MEAYWCWEPCSVKVLFCGYRSLWGSSVRLMSRWVTLIAGLECKMEGNDQDRGSSINSAITILSTLTFHNSSLAKLESFFSCESLALLACRLVHHYSA